jgi:hypothetical protein
MPDVGDRPSGTGNTGQPALKRLEQSGTHQGRFSAAGRAENRQKSLSLKGFDHRVDAPVTPEEQYRLVAFE